MTSPGDFSNNWDISDSQVSRALPSHFLASTGDNLVSPILDSSTHADPSLTGRKLNSFIPIFELLGPKFVLDQDAYYIHGVVDDDDLAILWDYSSMVTELVLDSDVENGKPNIAPSTFIHLAQLLKPDSPLLPSLSHLRIIQAETSFPYLHLLHTPSFKALEATNVPEHQHPSFFSFLTTLVHKTPLLENIILGPGLFPSRSLQTILKFTHLHQLELRDAALTIDFTFFQGVGALPNLESFILDTRSCNYIARIPQKPSNSQTGEKTPKLSSDIDTEGISRDVCSPIYEDDGKTLNSSSGIGIDGRSQNAYSPYPSRPIYENNKEVSFQSPKLSSSDVDHDGPSRAVYLFSSRPRSPTPNISKDEEVHHPLPTNYDKISCDTASPTSAPGGFYPLKKFHFVGGLPLIQDLISYIASSTLENISITLIHPLVEFLKQAEIDAENMMKVEAERRREADQETKQRIMAITKSRNKPSLERRAILREAEEQEALCQEIEERQKAERVQKRLKKFSISTLRHI